MKKIVPFIVAISIIIFGGTLYYVIAGSNGELSGQPEHTVSVAMATDDNYTYPTIVAMTSILENKKSNTKMDFYIMLSGDFPQESKDKISSLKNKYRNCDINLIDMKDKFKNLYTSRYITEAAYYRLTLASLLPNLNKVLYLDTDMIIHSDLFQLFNTDISDYYIAGVKDVFSRGMWDIDPIAQEQGYKTYAQLLNIPDMNQYINSGMLLINLDNFRKDNIEQKLIETARNNNFNWHDQDAINSICYGKIKFLPLKYNIIESILNNPNQDKKEQDEAKNHPVISHFVVRKPWIYLNDYYVEYWWKYAEKTDYFKEIQAKYLLSNGTYSIESALDDKKVLDIDNASRNNFANLQLYDKNFTNAQKFKVVYNTEGYYTVEALCSNKMLNVENSEKNVGANINQNQKNNSDAQKWYIMPCGDGYYHIVSKYNNQPMEVADGQINNGSNIRCCNANDSDAQKFKFVQ